MSDAKNSTTDFNGQSRNSINHRITTLSTVYLARYLPDQRGDIGWFLRNNDVSEVIFIQRDFCLCQSVELHGFASNSKAGCMVWPFKILNIL